MRIRSYRVSQKETLGVSKIQLPEYHQSNDIKNCLVLSMTCQIKFSDLPSFNPTFLPVQMGDFLQKASFENQQKRVRCQARFPFVLLPSHNDSWMRSCVLSSWENGIPWESVNKLFTLGGRLFTPSKGKHVPKRADSRRCEVNTLGIFACNFKTFFKASQRASFQLIAYRV